MNSSQSNTRSIAWMIWVIASIFYAFQYILRVMPNIMLDDIMQQFDIGAATFGQFSGVYYIGYSLMHLPIGIMLDRFGPKKVMSSCILLTVVGLSPLIMTDYWVYPIFGRLLIGIGSSAAILGLFKIIRMTFKEEHFTRMLSFSATIGLMGAIYGGGPVSYLRDMYGYQVVVQIFAVVGVLLAILTYFVVPEMKKTEQKTSIRSDVKEVISNRKVIWSCIFAGLMVGPLEGFADVWGSAFLKQVYGYEGTIAASLPSMIFVGMCFGAPLLSFIAEKIGYLAAIVVSGFMMAASFFTLLALHMNSQSITISFILVGICCAYQILAIYKASTFVREEVAGLTTAIANMIIMIFGYVFHTTIGNIVNVMGGPTESQALIYGVAVVPVGLLLGTIGFGILYAKERADTEEKSTTISVN